VHAESDESRTVPDALEHLALEKQATRDHIAALRARRDQIGAEEIRRQLREEGYDVSDEDV
jgi:hypothetical protein